MYSSPSPSLGMSDVLRGGFPLLIKALSCDVSGSSSRRDWSADDVLAVLGEDGRYCSDKYVVKIFGLR